MAVLLEVRDLVKRFGAIRAVDGISFEIPEGVCFGLLGPNGAGKTTAIEVIEGIRSPTAGAIWYKGKPRDANFHQKVGIQFQHTELLAFLTIQETLKTFARFYQNQADFDTLVATCDLAAILNQRNDRISGGQKQRVLLAMALINDPELVFLDEPSTGLDPQARRNLWRIVRAIRDQGKTLVLTTHYMEEAEFLCDTIAIVDKGRIIAQGTPDELIRQHCQGVSVFLPVLAFPFPLERLSMDYRKNAHQVEIRTRDINGCLRELMAGQVDLSEITVRSANLEDLFLKLTGRKLRE